MRCVRADHFGEAVGVVRRGGVAAAAHFAEADPEAGLGELPCGFGSGEAATDDVDVVAHEGRVAPRGEFVTPALSRGPPAPSLAKKGGSRVKPGTTVLE
jgi:hypothetical protein